MSKSFELSKNSLIYLISSLLNNGTAFFLLPILTAYYSTQEYGIYSIIVFTSTILGGFFCLGAPSSYSRFFFGEGDKEINNTLLSKVIKLSLIGGVFFVGFIYLTGNEISIALFGTKKYFFHLLISCISSVLIFVVNIAMIDFQFKNKANLFLIISFIGILVNITCTYLLLAYYGFGILSPILGLLLSNILISTFFIFLNFKKIAKYFHCKIDKEIIKFGLNSSILGLLFYLVDFSDRYFIDIFLSLSEVGIYSLGYKLGMIVNVLIVTPFSYAWAPIRLKYISDIGQNKLTSHVISLYFIASALIILGTIFFIDPVFKIIFIKENYLESIKLIPIIMYSALLYGITSITNLGIYINNKLWIQNIILLIALIVNVILNYFFLKKYGLIFAALSTLVSFSLISVFISVISFKYTTFKVNFFNAIFYNIICFGAILLSLFSELLESIDFYFKIGILLILILPFLKELKKLKTI